MSILYDEGQEAIGVESLRLIDARTDQALLLSLLEGTGSFDSALHETMVEQGWMALAIPEEHGGLGLGLVELGLVAQAAGSAPSGSPFLSTSFGAARLIEASGKADVQEIWLPRIADGSATGTFAFGEGHQILPLQPETYFADGRLSGVKHGVTAGLAADFAIVWALREGQPALVLAELETVSRTPIDSFDNSRLYADLSFAGCPATLLLEGEDARRAAIDALASMAVVTAHEQVGGAERLITIARDFANTRKAFGQPIGGFQSVKHRIAELYGLVEIARANCIHAAACQGTDQFLAAAACARLSATEAYDTAARDTVQIHGGIGVTWESGLHLQMRRARSLAIELGNMLFWEDLLVDRLAGDEA
ncbi:MAG: acyl-CoA dehydrogenase family protein [Novosphingobium sp.]|nr:acyl-CoA dehydrogenase family protein [Novosphingobium sp.]